jgi:hypothetical protein
VWSQAGFCTLVTCATDECHHGSEYSLLPAPHHIGTVDKIWCSASCILMCSRLALRYPGTENPTDW